jgi:hypothetical protein
VPANDARWLTTLGNFLAYLEANGVSGTYWAGGPGSVNSPLSVEPTSNYTVDKPQMAIIGNGTGTPPPPPPPPPVSDPALVVSYDFLAGDTIAPKNGWVFSNPNWPMGPLPGGGGNSMPFTYGAEPAGEDGWSEHRFAMPSADEFWIRLRWHVPANYHHRVDTYLEISNAYAAGWRVGDIVRGRDGTSQAAISRITSTIVWLRDAPKSYNNDVWLGQLTNLTRSTTLTSTVRRREPVNNKLLAIWCDDYSSHGKGSTIVWQTDHWTDNTENVVLTVGYSVGNNTVTGGVVDGGILIRPADYGKYMDIIFHGKFSTSQGANNGIIRSWVRKEGQTGYTRFHNITNANMNKPTNVPASEQFWKRGYLMGWSNSGFDQTTTFHLSKIEYYNALPAVLNP